MARQFSICLEMINICNPLVSIQITVGLTVILQVLTASVIKWLKAGAFKRSGPPPNGCEMARKNTEMINSFNVLFSTYLFFLLLY